MLLTMLGVGSSAGTPVVGCSCATCTSTDIRNKRSRCSSLITLDSGENILIDTGPDLRSQALRENIKRVDAVLYTHTHADHLHGIDDLRAFCQIQRSQIPLYAKDDAVSHITQKFGYTLREPLATFWDLPVLRIEAVSAPFELFGVKVTPIPVQHGKSQIFGYRIGNMAYMTDVSEIPESSFELLKGLDILLIDCLREAAHPTHINIEQSLDYVGRINANRSYMIHMTHELEYATLTSKLANKLQNDVFVGYDGLKLRSS
jgi:phosphoribosyl 1,2-cyclic phosphate phosphodiesterase